MPYRVNCPTCQTAYSIPEDSLGKKLLCAKCRHPFTVGNPKAAAPAAPKPPLPSARKAATGRTTANLPPPSPDTTSPGGKTSQADAAPAAPPPRRKKSPLLIVGVLAAVLLVVCGGIVTAVVAGISYLKHRLETAVAQDVTQSAAPAQTKQAANEGRDAKLPPDLDLVPAKEALVLSVHPAKLWNDPALARLRKLAETNKEPAAGLARLKQETGLAPGDIERLVIIFWGKQASPNSVGLVTTVKALDRPRILGMIGPEQREEKVGDKSLLTSPKSEFALHLLNERTFLYGRAAEVKKLLEQPPRAARTEKWNEVLRSAPRHALQIAVQHDLFPDDPKKQTPPALQELNPLLDAHTVVATLDAGKELRLSLRLQFNSEAEAKQGEQAAKQGLNLAAVYLNQFAASFKKAAPGSLPPPLAKLVAGVDDAEAAIKKATIQTKDNVLSCDIALTSDTWPEALAGVLELLLSSPPKAGP